MNRLPWFRWFPGDQEHNNLYRSLNLEELGFFHKCLNYDWINGGLPRDMNKLARLLGLNPRTVRKLWPRISSAFQAEFGLNSTSIQAELERNSARKKSQLGLESANLRWVPNANQNQNQNQNHKEHLIRSETVRQGPARSDVDWSEPYFQEKNSKPPICPEPRDSEAGLLADWQVEDRLEQARNLGWSEERIKWLIGLGRKPIPKKKSA